METKSLNYYQAGGPSACIKKHTYTAAQKWLLIVALFIGLLFDYVWHFSHDSAAVWMRVYAGFWLISGALYAVFFRKNWNIAATVTGIACVLLIGLIFLRGSMLMDVNVFALPLMMMLFACCLASPLEKGREGYYALEIAKGFFLRPFYCIPRFFGAIGAAFKGAGNPKARMALIGVIAAVPIAAVVLALLISADGVMAYYASEAVNGLRFGKAISHTLLTFLMGMLFYSLFFSLHYVERKPLPALSIGAWEPVTLLIPLGVILVCYALFGYVQFSYLFASRGLPEGLTYSRYAVEGFRQLMWVAAINFALFGLCVRFVKPTKAVTGLLIALLLATVLLLISALTRLGLYIDAYGLTIRRILSLWMMVYLCAFTAMCAIKLFFRRFALLKYAALVFIGWYLALNLVDLYALTPI